MEREVKVEKSTKIEYTMKASRIMIVVRTDKGGMFYDFYEDGEIYQTMPADEFDGMHYLMDEIVGRHVTLKGE